MQFSTLIRYIAPLAANDRQTPYPRAERREVDISVCSINKQAYPVLNWSQSGVLLHGDDRLFGMDDELDIVLRFRLSDRILEIPHRGQIARKGKGMFALHFAPVPSAVKNKFSAVVDDYKLRQQA